MTKFKDTLDRSERSYSWSLLGWMNFLKQWITKYLNRSLHRPTFLCLGDHHKGYGGFLALEEGISISVIRHHHQWMGKTYEEGKCFQWDNQKFWAFIAYHPLPTVIWFKYCFCVWILPRAQRKSSDFFLAIGVSIRHSFNHHSCEWKRLKIMGVMEKTMKGHWGFVLVTSLLQLGHIRETPPAVWPHL